jgi:hypothetical protein
MAELRRCCGLSVTEVTVRCRGRTAVVTRYHRRSGGKLLVKVRARERLRVRVREDAPRHRPLGVSPRRCGGGWPAPAAGRAPAAGLMRSRIPPLALYLSPCPFLSRTLARSLARFLAAALFRLALRPGAPSHAPRQSPGHHDSSGNDRDSVPANRTRFRVGVPFKSPLLAMPGSRWHTIPAPGPRCPLPVPVTGA